LVKRAVMVGTTQHHTVAAAVAAGPQDQPQPVPQVVMAVMVDYTVLAAVAVVRAQERLIRVLVVAANRELCW